ncbi:MAG TPA: AzlC family ABC transporter permease [Selenomonadales bacterium]|nr:AzlC family ABC transporter permease [Selenomonadales bacterium]
MFAEKPLPVKRAVNAEFWRAVGDSAPVMLGVLPFGITYGVVGVSLGLTPAEAILMSLVVCAGAAQFISVTMIGMGVVDFSLIVFTTLLINLRHLLMGASLAPYLTKVPLGRQAVLAFVLVDESYAIMINRIRARGYDESYQLGTNTALYVTWATSTILGVAMGEYIPDPLAWGLDFAMPATFLAMLVPRLVSRTSVAVCLTAAVIAVASALYLPGKWYIIVACLAASLAGGLLEGGGEDAA